MSNISVQMAVVMAVIDEPTANDLHCWPYGGSGTTSAGCSGI